MPALLILVACGRPALGSADAPIVMELAVAPDAPAAAADAGRLAQLLEDRTGLTITVRIAGDADAVRQALGNGEAHVGWLDPVNYLLAHEWYGVDVALMAVRSGTTNYQGQVVVRADGGIHTLADLRGRTMCWSDPASTADSILPRVTLRANGFDPDRDLARNITLASPRDVVMAVYDGTCDAGATYADAREAVETDVPDMVQRVVVLITTAVVPQEGVAFLPDFPADARARIVSALQEIVQSDTDRPVLQALCAADGLEKAEDSFYTAFRADLAEAGIKMVDLVERK